MTAKIEMKFVESNFLTRWPCTVCGFEVGSLDNPKATAKFRFESMTEPRTGRPPATREGEHSNDKSVPGSACGNYP